MAEETQRAFSPQRIYVKDISFEAPHAPEIFLENWDPEVKVDMDNTVSKIDDDGIYDIQLKVTVTATLKDKTAYIAEVVQAGVFRVSGFDEEDRKRLTGATCPEMLYPYARTALANLITQGSFPVFLLTPVSFDYIYSQRAKSAAEETAAH